MLNVGINYSQMYDFCACLRRDGELLFAVGEERMSLGKHDARYSNDLTALSRVGNRPSPIPDILESDLSYCWKD